MNIKLGDRVRAKGVSESSDEFDTGTVISLHLSGAVTVKWDRSDETYEENPDDLIVELKTPKDFRGGILSQRTLRDVTGVDKED